MEREGEGGGEDAGGGTTGVEEEVGEVEGRGLEEGGKARGGRGGMERGGGFCAGLVE